MRFEESARTPRTPGAGIEQLTRVLEHRIGLRVDESLQPMLVHRLRPIMARMGTHDFGALARVLEGDDRNPHVAQILDVVIPKETRWFRTPRLWRWLAAEAIPEAIGQMRVRRRLRVWCAGCSSGEEAYSFSLLFSEHMEASAAYRDKNVEILGTDVALSSIYRAISGNYDDRSMDRGFEGEFAPLAEAHFVRDGALFRIDEESRERCRFEPHNLLDAPYRFGSFDFILLRNVLTFLTPRAGQRVLDGMEASLVPGGVLIPGVAEGWAHLRLRRCREVSYGGLRVYRRER